MSNVGSNLNANQGAGDKTVSTGDNFFIVPFIADLAVDAEGTIGVTQQADVTITNIDAKFDVTMSLVHSAAILNAFTVKDEDLNGTKNATDASSGSIVNVAKVGTVRGDALKAAILAMLDDCMTQDDFQAVGLEKADEAKRSLKEYIRYQGYSDTLSNLMMDTLAGFLEASDLNSFNVTVDGSGGAHNMVGLMSADAQTDPAAAPSAAAKYRRAILTQLPEANIEKYVYPTSDSTTLSMEDITKIEFMPMLVEDKLVFVFDLTLGEVSADKVVGSPWTLASSGAKMERVIIDRYPLPEVASASVNTLGGVIDLDATAKYADENDTLLITRPTKRRIAIIAKMSTDGGYAKAAEEAFHIENAAGKVFNPDHSSYPYASAAGLLDTGVETDLKVSTQAWREIVPTFEASKNSASIEIDQVGGIAVATVLTLSVADGDLTTLSDNSDNAIGGWVVVNASANKNVFSVDTSVTPAVVKYSGKTVATADSATLYRVTNFGLSEGRGLTATATIKQD